MWQNDYVVKALFFEVTPSSYTYLKCCQTLLNITYNFYIFKLQDQQPKIAEDTKNLVNKKDKCLQ